MLAYGMNCHEGEDGHVPLPPDHGYPVRSALKSVMSAQMATHTSRRLMIPGWVGGRCVKWIKRIWISDKENDSHYHSQQSRLRHGDSGS